MADAITELRRVRMRLAQYDRWPREAFLPAIDARIAELEAAQQAEPSDAEIEEWRERSERMMTAQEGARWVLDAVALMRRDAKLREAARLVCERATETWTDTAPSSKVVAVNPSDLAALRAAMGES